MLEEVSSLDAGLSGAVEVSGDSGSSTSFRLRFLTILFDTVAACNPGIVSFVVVAPALKLQLYSVGVAEDIESRLKWFQREVTWSHSTASEES